MSREDDDRDGEPDEARTRSLNKTLANLPSAYNGESETRRLISRLSLPHPRDQRFVSHGLTRVHRSRRTYR